MLEKSVGPLKNFAFGGGCDNIVKRVQLTQSHLSMPLHLHNLVLHRSLYHRISPLHIPISSSNPIFLV